MSLKKPMRTFGFVLMGAVIVANLVYRLGINRTIPMIRRNVIAHETPPQVTTAGGTVLSVDPVRSTLTLTENGQTLVIGYSNQTRITKDGVVASESEIIPGRKVLARYRLVSGKPHPQADSISVGQDPSGNAENPAN